MRRNSARSCCFFAALDIAFAAQCPDQSGHPGGVDLKISADLQRPGAVVHFGQIQQQGHLPFGDLADLLVKSSALFLISDQRIKQVDRHFFIIRIHAQITSHYKHFD